MTPAPGRPRVGVLALQGDVREHLRLLEAVGARAVAVRRAADLPGLDGVVLPGGESTTIGKLLDVTGLLGPLRQAIRSGLPAYGSCAGMVLLADRVLDGACGQQLVGGLDVTVRRNAFGRQVDSSEYDLDFIGILGGPLHAVFIRAPWVESVGARVEVLASTPSPDSHVVAVRQGSVLATAFHPELVDDPRVHALFLEMVRASGGSAAAGASGAAEGRVGRTARGLGSGWRG